jgi:hypothetical protein
MLALVVGESYAGENSTNFNMQNSPKCSTLIDFDLMMVKKCLFYLEDSIQ